MPAEKRSQEHTFGFMFEALISGQQRMVTHFGQILAKVSDVATEMVKLNRNQIQIRSEMGEVRASMDHLRTEMERRFEQVDRRFEQVDHRSQQVDQRFEQVDRRLDAVLVRLEELDNAVDQNSRDLKNVRIELVGQYNEILNALQAGNSAHIDINEINERLDELERRAGLK